MLLSVALATLLIEQALHGVIEGSDTGDVHPGAIALEVPGNGRK